MKRFYLTLLLVTPYLFAQPEVSSEIYAYQELEEELINPPEETEHIYLENASIDEVLHEVEVFNNYLAHINQQNKIKARQILTYSEQHKTSLHKLSTICKKVRAMTVQTHHVPKAVKESVTQAFYTTINHITSIYEKGTLSITTYQKVKAVVQEIIETFELYLIQLMDQPRTLETLDDLVDIITRYFSYQRSAAPFMITYHETLQQQIEQLYSSLKRPHMLVVQLQQQLHDDIAELTQAMLTIAKQQDQIVYQAIADAVPQVAIIGMNPHTFLLYILEKISSIVHAPKIVEYQQILQTYTYTYQDIQDICNMIKPILSGESEFEHTLLNAHIEETTVQDLYHQFTHVEHIFEYAHTSIIQQAHAAQQSQVYLHLAAEKQTLAKQASQKNQECEDVHAHVQQLFIQLKRVYA